MKTLRRLVLGGVLALALLGAAAVAGVVLAANALTRQGIEAGATYALGVDTTLGRARVGLLSGELGLARLEVDNPEGFQAPRFLSLGDAGVAVTLASLTRETIEVPRFSLDALDVYLERRAGSANYGVILDNLKRLSGPAEPGKPKPKGKEKRLIVRDLSITNVTIHADLLGLPAAPGAGALTIPIKEVRLSDVGRTGTGVGGSGVTVSELSSIIVQAVLAAAVENGGGVLPEDLARDLVGRIADAGGLRDVGVQVGGRALENVRTIADGLGQSVGGALGAEAGKAVEDAGKALEEAAKKGLEGILGGKKDDKK